MSRRPWSEKKYSERTRWDRKFLYLLSIYLEVQREEEKEAITRNYQAVVQHWGLQGAILSLYQEFGPKGSIYSIKCMNSKLPTEKISSLYHLQEFWKEEHPSVIVDTSK